MLRIDPEKQNSKIYLGSSYRLIRSSNWYIPNLPLLFSSVSGTLFCDQYSNSTRVIFYNDSWHRGNAYFGIYKLPHNYN